MLSEKFFTMDPLREMARLQQEMNRLFNTSSGRQSANYPLVNIWQNEEGVVITSELPGYHPEDIHLSVLGDVLTISGVRKLRELKEGERYHRQERVHGDFERKIRLPFPVDSNKVEARFHNGVLTVQMPRAEEDKPKKIKIVTN